MKKPTMNLGRFEVDSLLEYTAAQLATFYPDGSPLPLPCFRRNAYEALERVNHCISAARMWEVGYFNHLQSSHYLFYLYFLSNTIWRNEPHSAEVCTRLFLLNKALNGIDLFYEIAMPDVFLIGHSTGIVLTKAIYGNYLVLHQNCTVGKSKGVSPVLGEGVVLYPNSAIIGRSNIGNNVVVAQGTSVINQDVPQDSTVFRRDADVTVKPCKTLAAADFFRL